MIGKIARVAFVLLLVAFVGVKFLPWGNSEFVSHATDATLVVPNLVTEDGECCEYAASFKSIRSVWSLEQEIERILRDNYTELKCLNEDVLYYDADQDLTVRSYNAKLGFPFNEVVVSYEFGKGC